MNKKINSPPKCTEKIANRLMLNNPSVQKRHVIGRLIKYGQVSFDSLPLSFCSRSSSSPLAPLLLFGTVVNLGRISLMELMTSGMELEPVLETIETGLELRDDAIELCSE